MNQDKRGWRHALYLALVSAAARGPGFIVPIVIGAVFGAGTLTDAYFLAYSAVLLIGGTIGQGVEVAIVPFAARASLASELREFLKIVSKGVGVVGAILWTCAVIVLFATAGEGLRTSLLRYAIIFTPLAILWSAAGAYTGALISQWQIARASGSMLWRGLGAALGLAFVPFGGGLASVGVGLGVGELCRVLWLRQQFPSTNQHLTQISRLTEGFRRAATAQVLAGGTGTVVPVVERMIASTLGPGGISHLEYATRLLVIPTLIFDGALAPLLLARWSSHFAIRNEAPLPSDIFRAIGKGMSLAGIVALPIVVFAPFIVSLVLGHGKFTPEDTTVVASLLRVLGVGFVASMGALLFERLYLAAARNKTLAALSVVRGATRVVTAFALVSGLKIIAFGFSYCAAEILYLLLLAIFSLSRSTWTLEALNAP